MKKQFATASAIIAALIFGGCTQPDCPAPKTKPMQTNYKFNKIVQTNYKFNKIVNKIANDLINCEAFQKNKDFPFVFTSFVNLHDFSQTSNFGRMLSETLMSEVVKKGIKVVDFRGQNVITIDKKKGEFFLSRVASRLKPQIKNAYIVVGTYSAYGNGIVVNARIIDNKSGAIVSASNVIIKDPLLLSQVCTNGLCNTKKVKIERTIRIEKDPCDKSGQCE